jgi:hypothetical protein
MAENNSDLFARAFATLTSLRANIDRMPGVNIPEIYVSEFHTVLDKLAGIALDIADFRIPNSEVRPRVTSINTLTFHQLKQSRTYSEEKYVDKPFILTKIDAILGYFELTMSDKPRNIGFRKPGE